ncbi:MAG: hypothetical protein ING73_00755 [Rhodocyclaceae bacterium]|nr:hypothetical protein [Rhodocyclaceae bacterium]
MKKNDQHTIWLAVRDMGEAGATCESLVAYFKAKGTPVSSSRAGGALSRLWHAGNLERRQDLLFNRALRYIYTAPAGIREPMPFRGGANARVNIEAQPDRGDCYVAEADMIDDDSLDGFQRSHADSFGFIDPQANPAIHATNAFLGIRKAAQ